MKRVILTAAVLAGLGASATYGNVVAEITPLGVPDDGSGTGPETGYTAYKISLVSDSGNITAVDFSSQGASGKTISVPNNGLSQVWSKVKKNTFTSPDGDTTTTANSYDSYFIIPQGDESNVSFGSSIVEDNDFTTSPFAGDNVAPPPNTTSSGTLYGGGSSMGGAWGISNTALQSSTMDIAYVVIKDSDLNLLPEVMIGRDLYALLAMPQIATENGTFSVPVGPILNFPEPASLSLAGIALLGAAARRSRRSIQ